MKTEVVLKFLIIPFPLEDMYLFNENRSCIEIGILPSWKHCAHWFNENRSCIEILFFPPN